MKKLILRLLAGFVILPTICFAQWVARYNGPANTDDKAHAIAVDGSGNVYVTGESNADYATIKYNSFGDTLWVRRYNGPGSLNDGASAIAIDESGNVCVTGWSEGSGTYLDYATIKYSSSGDTLWIRRYNGPWNGKDRASAIAVDDSGNVYVTGQSYDSSFTIHCYDYVTIKYNISGDSLWVRRYDGPDSLSDKASAIAVDGSGNVYVTGKSERFGLCYDYATIKYNSQGDTLWIRRYNDTGNGWDEAFAITVDDSGNVYVTGESYGYYATIKYNSQGDTLWTRRYNGTGNGWDEAFAIAVDDSGNVCVTGESEDWWGCPPDIEWETDYMTIKYNSSGEEQWVATYGGCYTSEGATAIGIDNSGNVYVTGWDSGNNLDYATIKYNSLGVEQWVERYNGPGNDDDVANAIAIDSSYVYVTGWSKGLGSSWDYATIKYSCAGVEERKPQVASHKLQVEVCPNPVIGSGIIRYELPDELTTRNPQLTTLKVYDLGGRLVKTLLNEEVKAGHHKIELMGGHDKPCPYKKGIYFIQLKSGEFTAIQKFIILE